MYIKFIAYFREKVFLYRHMICLFIYSSLILCLSDLYSFIHRSFTLFFSLFQVIIYIFVPIMNGIFFPILSSKLVILGIEKSYCIFVYRWSPSYNGSTLQWCKREMHSVEALLWILNFSKASDMWCDALSWSWSVAASRSSINNPYAIMLPAFFK